MSMFNGAYRTSGHVSIRRSFPFYRSYNQMGLRGPIPDPDSRRGRAKQKAEDELKEQPPTTSTGPPGSTTDEPRVPAAGLPDCPTGLPARVEEIWHDICANLAAAQVPIKQVDSYAILQVARCFADIEDCDQMSNSVKLEPRERIELLKIKMNRDNQLIKWLPLICATPAARARIGIKPPEKNKGGPLADILKRKMQQRG